MEIIAHRGASYDAPENTLAAVALAWQQNTDAVEVDVHVSRDGEIVVIHDETTRKTAGVGKKVGDQTLAELKTLDVGRWKDERWAGERIPTLAEVMMAVPSGKRLFVEIKGKADYVAEFARTFRRSGLRPGQVIAIGFAFETMVKIKRTLPEIEVCWIAEFKRNWRTGGWSPKAETMIQQVKDARLDGLDLDAKGPINAKLGKLVKEARLKLYVWTVDSPIAARNLAAAGVDGITTNRPGWLRERIPQNLLVI